MSENRIPPIYGMEGYENIARELAAKLGAAYLEELDADYKGLRLVVDEAGLSLTGISSSEKKPVSLTLRADFAGMKNRLRPGNLQQEMLIRAVRIKGEKDIRVLDATAGLGEDSILLAAAGFSVDMYEYDPVIAALLQDALRRGALDESLKDIVSRMSLTAGDSIKAMKGLAEQDGDRVPDVILLDPMFPARQKSALVQKKFQLLQQLESPCSNEEELLAAAIMAGPRKVVIKRPVKGPYLAGRKPDYSLSGKAIRYDCINVVGNKLF